MSRPPLRFSKMHGAGNDFVVIDRRDGVPSIDAVLARRLADRHRGVGCDQILCIERSRNAAADLAYSIWNADGSAAGQCGNGARCVAAWARRAGLAAGKTLRMDSPAGLIEARFGDDDIEVGMGVPNFEPAAIPLRVDERAERYPIRLDDTSQWFGAVSMGNPHAVLEVADVDGAAVARWGERVQNDPRFPDRCNVGFAQVLAPDHIRLRVYERGVGETLACGSGACAAVAVLQRWDRVGAAVAVDLPGGCLHIERGGADAALSMRGPAEFVFEGELIA